VEDKISGGEKIKALRGQSFGTTTYMERLPNGYDIE